MTRGRFSTPSGRSEAPPGGSPSTTQRASPAVLALLPLVRPDVLKLDFRGMKGTARRDRQDG